jgi:hypothetical protein
MASVIRDPLNDRIRRRTHNDAIALDTAPTFIETTNRSAPLLAVVDAPPRPI